MRQEEIIVRQNTFCVGAIFAEVDEKTAKRAFYPAKELER